MKLKRVENSIQKVISATAPNSSSATESHSHSSCNPRCRRLARQRFGNKASYKNTGASNTQVTIRSNHNPRANTPGHKPGGAASVPV